MTVALNASQSREARTWLQRAAIERASDAELAALVDEHGTELTLLQGDLEARDFSLCDEATLRAGIAYLEHQLAEIVTLAERRLRGRRPRVTNAPREDFQTRFDAMRLIDIIEAIRILGVPLHKRGRESWGRCPFHQERTPSFAVNAEKGVWHCHGCQRGGDLVAFVMERQHLNAVEALRFLEQIVDAPGIAT